MLADVAQPRHAIAIQEAQRLHACVIAEMLDRLAVCHSLRNPLTASDVLAFFETYGWRCPQSGHAHSEAEPLSVRFVQALDNGGQIVPANMRPVYRPWLLPGEYRVARCQPRPFPLSRQAY